MALSAPPPTQVSVGDIQLTSQAGMGPDAGFAEPPTATIPLCRFRSNSYICFTQEGTAGSLTAGGFSDAQGAFTANDVGRWLVVFSGANRLQFPITGFTGATTISVQGGATLTADSWYVMIGGGPTPAATPFLNQADDLLMSYTGSAGVFATAALRRTAIGDDFSLTTATKAIVRDLDNQTDIGNLVAPIVIGCDGCGAGTPAGLTFFVQLEAAAATERIVTQCLALGVFTVSIPDASWTIIRSRAASLTRFRLLVFRAGIVQTVNPAPDPPNIVNLLAGHGYLLDVSPVPATD